MTLGDDNGLYNEAKYEQVKKTLDRFASMENVDREWTELARASRTTKKTKRTK